MITKTFNRAVSALPADAARFTGHFHPVYSAHARKAASNDRYGEIYLPQRLELALSNIVEVETVNGRATKAVIRFPYLNNNDLVLVVCDPLDGELYVKTVWLNQANDSHATLRTAHLQHV